MKLDLDALLEPLARLAHRGGVEAYGRQKAGLTIDKKADKSVVTDADRAVEAMITAALPEIAPGIPIIGEEAHADGLSPDVDGDFFIIDAIDGTRAFSRGGSNYTVNIGLVMERRVVAGVVYAPALGGLYMGAEGVGAFKADAPVMQPYPPRGKWQTISVRKRPEDEVIAVVSHSNLDEPTASYLSHYDVTERKSVGSSLKFCLVAEGEADIYPRMARLSEWDTAAGQAVAEAAGATCIAPDGTQIAYGKRDFRHMPFIILGDIEPVLTTGE